MKAIKDGAFAPFGKQVVRRGFIIFQCYNEETCCELSNALSKATNRILKKHPKGFNK